MAKFWGQQFTCADTNKQYAELVYSAKNQYLRAIYQLVIDDEDQPLRLIRNGDIDVGMGSPHKINVNAVANMAILQDLVHCRTGIGQAEGATGTNAMMKATSTPGGSPTTTSSGPSSPTRPVPASGMPPP